MHDFGPAPALERAFYLKPTVEAARLLIGHLLEVVSSAGLVSGRIVETEAYTHDDAACHAFRGETARNRTMFGEPGHAYVYFIYGMHYCLNVVTGPPGTADAVLIRAVEPVAGLEILQISRPGVKGELLTSGPARLCKAFGIDRSFDGEDVVDGRRIRIAAGPGPASTIEACARIGIAQAEARDVPWRFIDTGSRFLSKGRASQHPSNPETLF